MLLSRLVKAPRVLPVGEATPFGNGSVSVTGDVLDWVRMVFWV